MGLDILKEDKNFIAVSICITIALTILSPLALYIWLGCYWQQRQILKNICIKYMFDLWEYNQTNDENSLKYINEEINKQKFENIKLWPMKFKGSVRLLETTYIKTQFNIIKITMDNSNDSLDSIKIIK